jgi:hypothetical protein
MNRRNAESGAKTAVSAPPPLPHTVPFGAPFQKLFGPCRTTQHELIRRGEIQSALVGDLRGRRVIFTQSYLDYLARQQAKEAAGEIGSRSPNRQPSKGTELSDQVRKSGSRPSSRASRRANRAS